MPQATPTTITEAPEAPMPSPTLTLYLRVAENDAPNDFDGGRLRLHSVRGGLDPEVLDVSLLIVARTDAFLQQWPWKTREAKQQRFYRLVLEEIPESDMPADPTEDEEIAALEARLASLKKERQER
jgi:hypothetical protein